MYEYSFLVRLKDQHVSGNKISPELVLFLTPAGRPRFLGDEALLFPALFFFGAFFDSVIFELKPSVLEHK